jgi:hypothetical protein
MFSRITRGQRVGWVMATALLCLVGAQAACAAEPRQFLFGTATIVAEISEPGVLDAAPSLTADELELFFVRAGDLYRARRVNKQDVFSTPEVVEELSILDGQVGGPSISTDGLTLHFARRSELTAEEFWSEIWVATRPTRDAPFDPPVSLSEAWGVTSEQYVAPDVSADGLSLYVTLWNNGDSFLQVASRAAIDEPWSTPQPIPELTGFQGRSGVSADGLALFYETGGPASRETPGYFGNIVVSQRESVDDPWSEPVNVGDAINGQFYNTEPHFTHDGSSLYFLRGSRLPDESDIIPDSFDIYQAPVLPFTAAPLSGQGGVYQQKFDSLGDSSNFVAQPFPESWTFTANDVIFDNATTRRFPVPVRDYAGAFNAGTSGDVDRALATNVTELETGQLQFRAQIEGAPVQALRLSVDVEAWQVRRSLATEPGEAAFAVLLDVDTGQGFAQLAELGVATTEAKLQFPQAGSSLDGNQQANRGSFDSGPLALSIPEGAALRLRFVPTGPSLGWTFGLDNLSFRLAALGDANVDGEVDLADFGLLKGHFGQQGQFTEGDFSGNGQIDLTDFGLLKDSFGKSGAASVPEPATWVMLLTAAAALFPWAARHWR